MKIIRYYKRELRKYFYKRLFYYLQIVNNWLWRNTFGNIYKNTLWHKFTYRLAYYNNALLNKLRKGYYK